MPSNATKGGASAPSNVLRFPQTGIVRQRRRESMGAAGLLALSLLDREGEAIPANVERFDGLGETPASRSPELLLALLIWSTLPPTKREDVRGSIRALAFGSTADDAAVRLHKLLSGRR